MKICFKCEKPIKEDDPIFMYAIEIPYVNLWFHRDCFEKIENTTEEYLLSNYDKLNGFVSDLHKK
jgi:hypothetical protein